jgi:LysR family transcriptional regulator of abg operon
MHLNPLRVFLAIVDTGSQRAAARALGLTQPAVTKALQKLESELDVRLFVRSVHGANLTEYGQAVLSHARLIDTELKHCVEDLNQIRGVGKGSISIALSHLPSTMLLPEVLRTFRRKWPDVSLRIAASTYPYFLAGLREGTLDFAIAPAPASAWPEDLSREPLMRTALAPIVRRGHALACSRRLSDLTTAEWILPTHESATAQALYAAAEKARLPRPVCRVTCETLTAMIRVVASSDLMCLVPSEMASTVENLGEVVEVKIADKLHGAELCLIRRRASVPTPAAAALALAFSKVARATRPQKRPPGDNNW